MTKDGLKKPNYFGSLTHAATVRAGTAPLLLPGRPAAAAAALWGAAGSAGLATSAAAHRAAEPACPHLLCPHLLLRAV